MISNITGVILCGGQSKRMGRNKAFLKINSETVIERIYRIMKSVFEETYLVTNEKDKYKNLTDKIFEDIYPGYGPLSGIHAGLKNSNTFRNFIVSCDMPFLTKELLEYICGKMSEADIVLPSSDNKLHPLCGIYNRNCLGNSENLLKAIVNSDDPGNKKVSIRLTDLIKSCNRKILKIEDKEFYTPDLMFNMNTYEDYLYLKSVVD